jgi:Flp pilus assembly protein TadD
MRLRAISLALSFAAIGSAFAPAIRADQLSAEKKAAAETLFEDGKRLKKEGNFLEAARKFEQVQKLDPGIGTLLHLAESYERAGFFASAHSGFMAASAPDA